MNTEQFDGHTPGPWMPRDINDGALPHNEADLALMATAPELLAEVKRLREDMGYIAALIQRIIEGQSRLDISDVRDYILEGLDFMTIEEAMEIYHADQEEAEESE